MSVAVICPACGTPVTLYKAPAAYCPHCRTAFPDALRQSAESTLRREKVGRPLLLTVGAYASPGIGGLLLLSVFLAATDSGSFTLNDEVVSGPEFLRSAGLLFVLAGGLCVAIGVGLHRERRWTRWLMMAYWLVQLAGSVGLGWASSRMLGATTAAAQTLFVIVVAWWYLFDKENVVAYYRSLERERQTGTKTAQTQGSGNDT